MKRDKNLAGVLFFLCLSVVFSAQEVSAQTAPLSASPSPAARPPEPVELAKLEAEKAETIAKIKSAQSACQAVQTKCKMTDDRCMALLEVNLDRKLLEIGGDEFRAAAKSYLEEDQKFDDRRQKILVLIDELAKKHSALRSERSRVIQEASSTSQVKNKIVKIDQKLLELQSQLKQAALQDDELVRKREDFLKTSVANFSTRFPHYEYIFPRIFYYNPMMMSESSRVSRGTYDYEYADNIVKTYKDFEATSAKRLKAKPVQEKIQSKKAELVRLAKILEQVQSECSTANLNLPAVSNRKAKVIEVQQQIDQHKNEVDSLSKEVN